MKILINTPDIDKEGGVAQYFSTLKPHFKQDVIFNYVGGYSSENIFGNLISQIKDLYNYIYILLMYNPDLVHINPSLCFGSAIRDALYVLITKIFRKRILVFWHGWYENFASKVLSHKSMFLLVFDRVGAHCVLSGEHKKFLSEVGVKSQIFTITTAFDENLIDGFSFQEKEYNNNILFLGRLELIKGIYETVYAFKSLKEKVKDANLYIAGRGPDSQDVKKLVARERITDVVFLGFISGQQKIDVFKNCSLYVLPSYTEGMPQTVLEAMAFGLPIITRPVGGIQDFFQNDKMGFMTDSKNPEVFAKIMGKLLLDKERLEQIGRYNYYYARKYFSSSSVSEELEKIYRIVLNIN